MAILCLVLASACSTPGQPDHELRPLEESETETYFNAHYDGNGGEIRNRCFGGSEKVDVALRGKCYVETCLRDGNRHKCTSPDDPRILAAYLKAANQNSDPNALLKCREGSLDQCSTVYEWGCRDSMSDTDSCDKTYDEICKNAPAIRCQRRSEPAHTNPFITICQSNGKSELRCELSHNGRYTEVVFQRKK
jgi:hypothetical protein